MTLIREGNCLVWVTVVWMCNPPVVRNLCLGGPYRDMCVLVGIGVLVLSLVGALKAPYGVV